MSSSRNAVGLAAVLTLAACAGPGRAPERAESLTVSMEETVDGKPSGARFAADVWTRELVAAGYAVDAGAKPGAKLNLLGSVEAGRVEAPAGFKGFVSYRARVSARLVRGADAGVLAAASADAGGLDLDPRLAAAKAIETAVRSASAQLLAQARRTVPGAGPPPDEKLTYADGRGALAVPGGIDARPRLLRRIGALCSSKNVAVRAGQEPSQGGVYRVDGEKLENGVFRIDFVCLY